MIKLDIINEVVTKTGITKTKAEMAVETVFESMKKPSPRGIALSCAALAFSMCVPARPALDATRARAQKFRYRPERPFASNRVRSCSRSISS